MLEDMENTEKKCRENMIRGEIKFQSTVTGQNEESHSIALFINVNGNEVENRGSGMEKVMLA